MRKSLITFAVAAVAALAMSTPAVARSGIPTGYYSCYQTTSSVWPPTGERTYSSAFVHSFTLFRNGTYSAFPEGLFNRDNHWRFAHGKLQFTSGPFWGGFRHAAGSYSRSGKLMPHSQLKPTQRYPQMTPTERYPLVLHDTRTNDSDTLPHRETSDSTFWYCKKR
jgi:hypothetical protein